MADYQKIDEEIEFLQNIQKYEQPLQSKFTPYDNSRTGGGCDDNDADESVQERLFGLTEMFPKPVRSAIIKTTKALNTFLKRAYNFVCNFSWFAFSTAIILFAPVIIEYELNNKSKGNKLRPRSYGPGTASI